MTFLFTISLTSLVLSQPFGTALRATTLEEAGCIACFCAVGKRCGTESDISCDTCPGGKYTSTMGMEECELCQPGTFSEDGSTSCTPCVAGKFSSEAATSCSDCTAGTFSGSGFPSCEDCDAGSYSSTTAFSCTLCEPGKFSVDRADKCSSCPAGAYSGMAAASCELCEVGKINTKEESATCSYCDQIVKGSTTKREGGTSNSDCVCEAGFFKSDETGDCERVEVGVSKNVTSMNVTTLHLEPNHWRNSDQSIDVRRCPSDSACLGGADPSTYCAEGHTGPYCGVCKPGFSELGSVAPTCEPCDGDTSGTIVLMVGGPFALLLAALSIYYCCFKGGVSLDDNDNDLALASSDELRGGRGSSISRSMSSIFIAVAKKTKRAASFFAHVNAPFRILLSYVRINAFAPAVAYSLIVAGTLRSRAASPSTFTSGSLGSSRTSR